MAGNNPGGMANSKDSESVVGIVKADKSRAVIRTAVHHITPARKNRPLVVDSAVVPMI